MRQAPSLDVPGRGRRAAYGAGLGLLVAALLGLLRGTDTAESIELRLVDVRTRAFAEDRRPDPRIVVMEVQDTDVEDVRRDLGVPWPWPLEYNAHIVHVLREAGVAVLVVDVLHLDRGAGPDDVPGAENLPEVQLAKRRAEAEDADIYGAALREFGKAVIGFQLADDAPFHVPAREEAVGARLDAADVRVPAGALERASANLPVRRVTEGAVRVGFANTRADLDGVLRQAVLIGRYDDHTALSLPLAAARTLTGRLEQTPDTVRVGEAAQRVQDGARFLVNHHAAPYPEVAPAQVLAWALAQAESGALPAAAREALEGKIVVFGINLAGQKDIVATPIDSTMHGPTWQATVLDNLLHGDGRIRAARGVDLALLFALAVLAGALGAVLPTRWLPHLVPLALAGLLVGAAWWLFGAGTSIDLATPLLALLLTWGGTFALRAFTEGRRNRWLEGVFGRYMSPSLVAALKRDPSLIALGGREREISILFSDVAGFTSLSERLTAPDVVRLLNRYLTDHCAAVMHEDGVIDKFEGDAVMAFFGDPVEQPDHALRACRAALAVHAKLPDLAPLLAELGIDGFHVRVGINSGRAVVGNMGSDQRFDYTCIGDSVNLASRLEGAGKAFGVDILIGAATAEAVGEAMLLKPLGSLVVVGKAEPVAVCELLATREEASEALRAHAAAFARAMEAAKAGDAEVARAALDEAAAHRPDDGPVTWLRGVLDERGGAPWDGVTRLTSK